MARYALESHRRLPRRSRPCKRRCRKVSGELKVGVIGSLGVRRDAASVPAFAALLCDADAAVAMAAAYALGDVGCAAAAQALGNVVKTAARRPETGRGRCQPGLRRTVAGQRSEAGGDRGLQILGRRRPAQARPFGRQARFAGRHQVGRR